MIRECAFRAFKCFHVHAVSLQICSNILGQLTQRQTRRNLSGAVIELTVKLDPVSVGNIKDVFIAVFPSHF